MDMAWSITLANISIHGERENIPKVRYTTQCTEYITNVVTWLDTLLINCGPIVEYNVFNHFDACIVYIGKRKWETTTLIIVEVLDN